MNVSEFLTRDISPFLMGAFYSRYVFNKEKDKIYTEVSYKISKYLDDYDYLIKSKDILIYKLNKICFPYNCWVDFTSKTSKKPQVVLRFILDNDLQLNENNFFNRLNVKLLSCEFIYDDKFNDEKKMFIRGFAESRGSIDTTRPLLALDYFYNSINEVKRARFLYDYLNVPFSVLNFNPRELQNDYITGRRKRNTQLRFNLYWYVKNIGLLNEYKSQIVQKAYNNIVFAKKQKDVSFFDAPEVLHSRKDTFEFILRYYSNNIFGKNLSNFEIDNIRDELNLNVDSDITSFKRNLGLIELIRVNTPDQCASCGTTKTYTHKNTGKQYFEYHHVISIGKNRELDDENNIVKLCPNCHRIVKRGSAPEIEQKTVITNILNNCPKVLSFAKFIYDLDDFNAIVQKIWENLK